MKLRMSADRDLINDITKAVKKKKGAKISLNNDPSLNFHHANELNTLGSNKSNTKEDNESMEITQKKKNMYQKFLHKKGPIKFNSKNSTVNNSKIMSKDTHGTNDKSKYKNMVN